MQAKPNQTEEGLISYERGIIVQNTIKALVVLLAMFMAGCSGSSGADKIVKETLDAMKELTDAFESGDKNRIMNVAKKLQALGKENKDLKLSEAENKRLMEKYKTQMEEQGKKMMASMMKAATSGKIKPEDMTEIGQMMQSVK